MAEAIATHARDLYCVPSRQRTDSVQVRNVDRAPLKPRFRGQFLICVEAKIRRFVYVRDVSTHVLNDPRLRAVRSFDLAGVAQKLRREAHAIIRFDTFHTSINIHT